MVYLPGGFSPLNAYKTIEGKAISTLGTALNLPEMGISEGVQGSGAIIDNTPQVTYTTKQPQNSNTVVSNETPASNNLTDGNGTGTSSSTYDPMAMLQYDQGIKTANDSLGRIDGQLGTAEQNIEGSYLTNYNTLTGQQAVANRDYDTNKNNQLQDYQGARSDIASNSRNLLLNARRLLGSQGAGGGSADRFAAPDAAQREATSGNAIVQKTNSRNLAALDTSHQDNEDAFGRSFKNLTDQKEATLRDTRSKFEQNRADVLSQIAQLTGQKALAQGQTYQQALAATQPYSQRISSILNTIDGLAANPGVIKAQDVTLARPDLAQYQWNRFAAPTTSVQDTSLYQQAAPRLTYQQEQDQNNQQIV